MNGSIIIGPNSIKNKAKIALKSQNLQVLLIRAVLAFVTLTVNFSQTALW